MAVSDLLDGPIPNEGHADAVLELAFTVSAVDGYLADEELGSFKELLATARGKHVTREENDRLLQRFVVAAHAQRAPERIRRIAPSVPPELRETAFKVAFGLSLVDRKETPEEDAIVADLATVLGLDAARSAALREEVRRVLSIGG